MKKTIIYSLIVLLGITFSCQTPNMIDVEGETPSGEVLTQPQLRNGILSFRSYADFKAHFEKMEKMSDNEYESWTRGLGFRSMYSEFTANDGQSTPKMNGTIKLNSINVTYARLSDTTGIVFIGKNTFQFTYDGIKLIAGNSVKQANVLRNTKNEKEYRDRGIVFSAAKIKQIHTSPNARYPSFTMQQNGNRIVNTQRYLDAKLEFKEYTELIPVGSTCDTDPFTGEVRCTPDYIAVSKCTGTALLIYWEERLFANRKRVSPQRFEFTCNFKVSGVPKSGYFIQSGAGQLYYKFYDDVNGNISEFNGPASAKDYYDVSGALENSETLFAFTN
jgi:hypothetical protein